MTTGYVHQLRLNFPIDDATIKWVEVPVSLSMFWGAYNAIHRGGLDESEALVVFGNRLITHLVASGINNPIQEFYKCWRWLGDHYGLKINRWDKDTDILFSFCYFLLREKVVTRGEAAKFATAILNEKLDQEQWRKRVDRWAHSHDLQSLSSTKRESRKGT